jgi:CheY-like chemotaxis protein
MSHDIRTPLNGIIGTLNILQKTNIDNEQNKYLRTCQNSSNMLLNIVNDILDLSKMETGKFTLDNQSCDIKTELNMVGAMFEATIKQKGLSYIANIDKNIPFCIICDINRLKQVFSNLLSNAVKFTKEGTITFEVDLISKNKENVTIKFNVKDTGIGIAKDKQNLIFEAFAQEDQTTSTKFGGTGLGTNIAKNIVELYDGKLEVKSELGVGSEFYFTITLNICNDKFELNEENKIEIKSFPNAKILVAEDNPTNQMVIEMLLEDFGIEDITLVDDGKDAFESYQNDTTKYDLILMDINMPIMGGIESLENIILFEQENNLQHIPTIALTANAMDEEQKYQKIGFDGYLAKPVDEADLLKILNKFIGDK